MGRKMDKKLYRFKEVREEYNELRDKVTQEDMAEICGTSNSTISRIEKCEIEPSAKVLMGYADTFGVSVDYLLGRSNAKQSGNSTAINELGLSDDAIGTLKFIRQNARYKDYNLSAFINAFIGSDEATFNFFDGLFNLLSAEYIHSKYDEEPEEDKKRYLHRLAQDAADMTMEYIRFDVLPKLKKIARYCYEICEQDELNTQK